ncbi:MAG: hypothetical protein QME90_14465 [Thermodesulfobacteriota bacterium]|nr:hypothetical protein [Thermodesulfobacteriota bacterium]
MQRLLREGEEMPGTGMTVDDKVEIARRLVDMGVQEVELGYVGALEQQREALKAIKKAGIEVVKSAIVRWYVKDWKEEIDTAVEAGADNIKIQTLGGPDWKYPVYPYNYYDYYKKGEIIPRMVEAVRYVKDRYGLYVHIGLTDGPRTDLGWMKKFFRAGVEAGANRVSFHDGLGATLPLAMQFLAEEIKSVVGGIPVLVHNHNDFGLATANTIGAILGGAEGCDVTVNGIGDRSGNASLEEVVTSLEMLCGVKTGIDMTKLYELSKFVEKVTGVKCQPHKAIVGENAFLEESELHIHGVMKGKNVDLGDLAYLPYAPSVVGQRHKIVWGTTSLWGSAIKLKMEQLGLSPSQENMEKVRKALQRELRDKDNLTDEEFGELCKAIIKR